MSLNIKMDLSEMTALEAAFEELGEQLSVEVMQEALRPAANEIRTAAKAIVPVSTDRTEGKHLRDTIVVRRTTSGRQRGIRRASGISSLAELFVGPTAPHSHLVEFGHQLVKNSKDGKRVIGQVGPRPYMRPAFAQVRGRFLKLTVEGIKPAFFKIIKKLDRQVRTGKLTSKTRRALK